MGAIQTKMSLGVQGKGRIMFLNPLKSGIAYMYLVLTERARGRESERESERERDRQAKTERERDLGCVVEGSIRGLSSLRVDCSKDVTSIHNCLNIYTASHYICSCGTAG